MIQALYNVYSSVFAAVVVWAVPYVGEDRALKVARHALARTWSLAASGYETENGVWALVFEHAYAMMLGLDGVLDIGDQVSATLNFPVPDEEVLTEVTRLYSVCWMLAGHGQLLLHERNIILAHALVFNAFGDDHLSDSRALAILAATAPPLRRALIATNGHQCENDVICTAAAVLMEDEIARGKSWAGAYCAVKGGTWPGQ